MTAVAGRSIVRDVRSVVAMSTVVSIEAVLAAPDADRLDARDRAMARAFEWFNLIESSCSRFEPSSEIVALSQSPGVALPVSPAVFQAVRFAVAVARDTHGAFDPTLGATLADRGFTTAHRTGRPVTVPEGLDRAASYRDVELDDAHQTITLHRPLLLDLGAVAKGLAIDMAARELAACDGFAIDAGGNLFVGGHNATEAPWTLGIRHPRQPGAILETVLLSGGALCTSGDYERPAPGEAGGHHILDARTRGSASGVSSVSVIAPTAMVADALATAAFALGPGDGLAFLARQGVEGVLYTDALVRLTTRGW